MRGSAGVVKLGTAKKCASTSLRRQQTLKTRSKLKARNVLMKHPHTLQRRSIGPSIAAIYQANELGRLSYLVVHIGAD